MILFENGLIKQEYDLHTDILTVDLPSFEIYELSLVRHSLDAIIETVKNYNIKKLLLDPSKAKMAVTPESVLEVMSKFYLDFMQTHLEKLARVRTSDQVREMKINALLEQVQLSYQFKNFTTKDEAMAWLTIQEGNSGKS